VSAKSFFVLAACCAVAACTRERMPERLDGFNLILINVDTLRADHLGCYGYERDTSPFIDELAAGGVTFTSAAANSSYTRESVASLFTGLLPSHSGATGWNARPSPSAATLAEKLRAANYRTVFLSLTTMLTDAGFTRGFDLAEHLTKQWGASGQGPQLSKRALEVLSSGDARPFFLYLHYLDPHGPYDPPPDALARFAGPEPPTRLELYGDVRPRLAELRKQGFGPGDLRFDDLVRRYDAEIYDTDRAIRQLFEGLRRSGQLERTVAVLTADHGEEFLEHGFVEHAWTLYEEVIRVPLIMWAPGHLEPQRLSVPVSSVDLLPTLTELLGISHDPPDADGRPLFSFASGRAAAVLDDRPQISELLIAERNALRSVRSGRWKYLHAVRWLPPDDRAAAAAAQDDLRSKTGGLLPDPWAAPVAEELYDLSTDPGESDNLLEREPGRYRELRSILAAYKDRIASAQRAPTAASLNREDAERMRALGY